MGMPSNSQVGDLMDKRSGNGTRGFAAQKQFGPQSFLFGKRRMEKSLLSLSIPSIFISMLLSFKKGAPILTDSEEVLHQLKKLSKEFGTEIQIKNGKGYIDMTAEA